MRSDVSRTMFVALALVTNGRPVFALSSFTGHASSLPAWLRQQRLGKPIVAKAVASKLEERRRADLIAKTNRPRKHHFACVVLTDAPAGFLTL